MIDPLQSGYGPATGAESCRICGGDGRIDNSFGAVAKCPMCHGSGKRSQDTGFHDVTKTKPSHHKPTNKVGAAPEKQTWPSTAVGGALANEIKASSLTEDTKGRLTREIIEYEETHGSCTQTFMKKIRKQFRPAGK